MADGSEDATALSPEDAFTALGNGTRMQILRTLSEADAAQSFSELRERVGMQDSGQFNYHLDQLVGHFVTKSDDGYTLRAAGRRVVEAVVSGAVTESVVMGPERLEGPCPYCGAAVDVSYREETLLLQCTECVGSFADRPSTSGFGLLPRGTLTVYSLPSAAVAGRSPTELVADAILWTYTEMMAVANGTCPRCAGRIEHELGLCRDHDSGSAPCEQCGGRFAIGFTSRCRTCGKQRAGTVKHHLLADPRVRSFFEARGVDTLAPTWQDMAVFYNYDERVLGTDPFEGEVTFTLGQNALTVTVDEALTVREVNREEIAKSN